MSGESARSLRNAALSVGALGALSLSVPMSLWLSPSGVFPVLRPVGHTVQARALDGEGRLLDRPARLRPGSSTEVEVTGFNPDEPILLRSSAGAPAVSGGRADQDGVFHYRLTVPTSMSGAHSLTVIGSLDQAGWQPGSVPRTAVFRFVVSADQAGDR
ncbi:hypothetical protein [Jatrophihabitans sp.]|jgi:hypothetical protein|uniref:hypothetical protein n=1 Tax=Jatrophihabitans sp. TaxID=1932789 RepID=UPI002EF35BBA